MGRAFSSTMWISAGLCLALFAAGCQDDNDLSEYRDTLTQKELNELNWKISFGYAERDKSPRLLITQSFVMPRKRMVLRLPDTFLRKEHLFDRIENLRVSGDGRIYDYPNSRVLKILEHTPGEIVEIRYQFRPDDPIKDSSQKESLSSPIIRNNYMQFIGIMVMIFPLSIISAPNFKLELNWQNIPAGFSFYNSYGAQKEQQNIVTNFDELRDAYFVIGNQLRVYVENVRERPVHIVLEGTWDHISDQDFIETVTSLLKTQRESFKDDDFPYFLVSFLADERDCNQQIKFGGTAHKNSFRAIFPNGSSCTFMPEMKQLISHELVHMWIGKKIRLGEQDGHIDGKWFTEGFTDFFGRVLAWRAGVLSTNEFFGSLNRQIEKYYISRERGVTLDSLVRRMYKPHISTKELEDIPYQQGEIMAWRIHARIKESSGFTQGLDDVIAEILQIARRAGLSKKFTVTELNAIFDKYAPGFFRNEYGKIISGKLFEPPKLQECNAPQKSFVTRYSGKHKLAPRGIIHYGAPEPGCNAWLQ